MHYMQSKNVNKRVTSRDSKAIVTARQSE